MRRVVWIAGVLALAACSQSTGTQSAGGEKGGLHVSVHELGEAQVQEVRIDLLPDTGESNAAPAPVEIVLRRGEPGVGHLAGPPAVWTWTEPELEPGAYVIQAEAFNQSNPGSGVAPAFRSVALPIVIQTGPLGTVSLFLHQHVDEDPFDNPYVTAVTFDLTPAQDQISRITVRGDGGEGKLSLEASGPGKLGKREVSPDPADWKGEGWDDARGLGGAKIDWEPSASGLVTLTLTLEDEEGNRSTVALVVNVGEADGDIDFRLLFNHSPWSKLSAESLIDAGGMSVEVTARYGDVESDTTVDYRWNVKDCIDEGFTVAPPPVANLVEGSIAADLIATHGLTFSAARAPLPNPPPSCVVTLDVEDRGLLDEPTAISTSTRIVRITLGTVHPCTGDLSACGTECVDLDTNYDHCGTCGNACGQDQTCTSGACLCYDPTLAACGAACVDVKNDDDHCGGCDQACGGSEVCELGFCDRPSPVPVGSYSYETKVVTGITDPKVGAWHPSRKYALVAENSGRVFKYQDGAIAQVTSQSGVTWAGITFSPDGSKAIMIGHHNTNSQGRIYLWDHAKQLVTQDATGTTDNSRYQHLTWSSDGELWLLAWNGSTSNYIAQLYRYEFGIGRGPVMSYNTGQTCTRMAWATDLLGVPVIVLVCNNYLPYLYPGSTMLEANPSVGSMADLRGRPQGDYALASISSNSTFFRFQDGAHAQHSVVTGVQKISFSPSGKRALLMGGRNGSTAPGKVWEYRHDLLTSAQVTNVDIPHTNFPAITDQITINDAVWKPGCDEGIILAGKASVTTRGYIIEFQVTNGKACPP